MDDELFREKLRRGDVLLVEDSAPLTSRLINTRNCLLQISENIDFECDFDDEGFCKSYTHAKSSSDPVKSCCHYCADNLGYFRLMPAGWISNLAEKFDAVKGFLGKGGCKIPRENRSSKCLGFVCAQLQGESKINGIDREVLYAIGETKI